MSLDDSEPLFPADFPAHLRRFARHITAVQTRGNNNSSTKLLFTTISSNQNIQIPTNYTPAYDSYDLKNHPIQIFRPNLFVDNIERLFVSVVPLWSSGINHLTRLTTWREPSRTLSWAIIYSICWWNELILPAILFLIICLSTFPKLSTSILFPAEKVIISSTIHHSTLHHSETEGEQVAQVAAAAAATFIDNPDHDTSVQPISPVVDLNSNLNHTQPSEDLTHSDSIKSNTNSSKLKEIKSGKKNLTQQYKPVIYKYGGGIQNIAGEICDIHERFANLFTRRFIPPPPGKLNSHSSTSSHPQSFNDIDSGIPANVRFSLPFFPLLLFSLLFSTETLGRCLTFSLGFIFFFLNPIQIRSKLIRDALDANQTILRGVPTHRAFVLATLRNMQQRHANGLDIAMKLLTKPKPPKLPQRKVSSLDDLELEPDTLSELSSNNTHQSSTRSTSSIIELTPSDSPISGSSRTSSPTPPVDLHKKLIKLAKKINRVTEHGTQLWSRASTYQTSDLSNFIGHKFKKVSNQIETDSIKSSSKANKLFRAISATRSNNLTNNLPGHSMDDNDSILNSNISLTNPESSSPGYFCYYGNLPGHLTLHFSRSPTSQPMLSFYSGLGQSFKVRKSLIVIPLNRIVGMRKVSMLNLAGVWGGIDGIEIWEKKSRNQNEESDEMNHINSNLNSSSRHKNSKLKHHTFRNLTKRDEAFLRILVLKDWLDDEEPGWIAV